MKLYLSFFKYFILKYFFLVMKLYKSQETNKNGLSYLSFVIFELYHIYWRLHYLCKAGFHLNSIAMETLWLQILSVYKYPCMSFLFPNAEG